MTHGVHASRRTDVRKTKPLSSSARDKISSSFQRFSITIIRQRTLITSLTGLATDVERLRGE